MDHHENSGQVPKFNFTEANVKRLKEKYSIEMRDEANNPIKVCMKLIFEAAIEKDPARRLALARELSEFLTKSDGVINLFLALIDFDTSSQKVTTHNQRFIAVSNIITCLPALCMPYEKYCQNIAGQLKPLLVHDNVKYSTLASIIIRSMIESPHAKGKDVPKIILDPIFSALLYTTPPPSPSTCCPTTTTACQFEPHEAILAIHNLIQNHLNIEFFVPMFPHLFYAMVSLNNTPSRLKSILRTCLVNILNGLSPGAASCLVENTLFYQDKIRLLYRCSPAEEGEISIRVIRNETKGGIREEKEEEELLASIEEAQHDETLRSVLISLLETSNNELFVLEFFFHFQETMWTAKDERGKRLSASIIEPLLEQSVEEESTKLDLLTIIAANSSKSLELISRTLLNYVSFMRCNSNEFEMAQKLISRSISSCFSILEVLCVTLHGDHDRDLVQRKCLPILRQIYELMVEKRNKNNHHQQQDNLCKDLSSLIERLEKILGDQSDGCPDLHQSKYDQIEREFSDIMKDLNDKLVPVRVHALVQLKQMVLSNDQHTISRIPQLYTVIEAFLFDQEPYVFLACINLMAEMAVRSTPDILPKLIDLYIRPGVDLQHRMNLGEVLVRLTRQMNETTPFYAQQVMSVFLKSSDDPEELMRMSSLMNIGEICHNLGDSLGKYMLDILNCIQRVIDHDTVAVKRAAVGLLRCALSGLNRLKVESIQRELKTIYAMLKRLKSRTLDEKLDLQADLALDEMDRLAREMLVGDDDGNEDVGGKLVKNIKVLSLLER